jgi:hypothetical protein
MGVANGGPKGPGTAGNTEAGIAGDVAVPETAGSVPEIAGSVPEIAGSVPETAGSVPETGGSVPGTGTAGGAGTEPERSPAVRASDRERDAVVQRVQQAFAEGRLDDVEFDERMRAALTARTHADLDVLLADLPAETAAPGPAPARRPGRVAIALKSSVRRGGRWRVPERYTTVVYKGGGWLDLRAAELSGPVTTFVAVAYKSRVTILVPPGVRVEMTGFGVTQGADEEDPGCRLPTDAPVIHVRGVAYKGTVEITTRPAGASRPAPVTGRVSRARDRPGGT